MRLTLQVILESSFRVRNGSVGLRVERRAINLVVDKIGKCMCFQNFIMRFFSICYGEPSIAPKVTFVKRLERLNLFIWMKRAWIALTGTIDSLHSQVFLLYLFILLQLPRDPLKDNCSFAHHIDVISHFQGEW
jgi:hypothetical protein